jgi:hypothetical protein
MLTLEVIGYLGSSGRRNGLSGARELGAQVGGS